MDGTAMDSFLRRSPWSVRAAAKRFQASDFRNRAGQRDGGCPAQLCS